MHGIEGVEKSKVRFGFGKNWQSFLRLLDEERIDQAEKSLKEMLEISNLKGKRFLDAGSGSGLFSLAARNLGAVVHSFDYDPDSVWCTRELRRRYRPKDNQWQIEQGDALNREYLQSLGTFDIVYSWGVLHHTGDMWRALQNVSAMVSGGGQLFISIYNDQRWLSDYWKQVKRLYNGSLPGKLAAIGIHAPYFGIMQMLRVMRFGSGMRRRGMDFLRDMLDWLGGYPFEVARPEEVVAFLRGRGFTLDRLTTVDGRHGCNEYVFRKGNGYQGL